MTTRNEMSFEDVLDELLFVHGSPTRDAIAIWAARYPEYRGELLDFAANWSVDDHLPVPAADEASEQSLHAKVVSQFRARTASVAPQTLAQLASAAGQSLEDLAMGLRIDAGVVRKLNARRIEPASIGRRMVARIAELLQSDPSAVMASWSGPQATLAVAGFLANSRPIPPETLREALTKVDTPPELILELEGD